MPEEVILLLGSNAGRRVRRLRDAVDALSGAIRVGRVSRIYGGAPSGRPHQPWFLNVAVRGETNLDPLSLLEYVKNVERSAGRKSAVRWGPRALDIDIILMGGLVVREPHLTIPHPRMKDRRFCLVPVAEIAPEVAVPPGGETIRDLLGACRDPLEVSLP